MSSRYSYIMYTYVYMFQSRAPSKGPSVIAFTVGLHPDDLMIFDRDHAQGVALSSFFKRRDGLPDACQDPRPPKPQDLRCVSSLSTSESGMLPEHTTQYNKSTASPGASWIVPGNRSTAYKSSRFLWIVQSALLWARLPFMITKTDRHWTGSKTGLQCSKSLQYQMFWRDTKIKVLCYKWLSQPIGSASARWVLSWSTAFTFAFVVWLLRISLAGL